MEYFSKHRIFSVGGGRIMKKDVLGGGKVGNYWHYNIDIDVQAVSLAHV
jgi:hypothetical protein